MKIKQWKVYLFWILLCESVGALSGWLSREGIDIYEATVNKPVFTPPGWVFPVVWSVLFALMGISAARIYFSEPSRNRNWGLNLFLIQLAVNFFWPLIFFNLQAFGIAFVWLILLWVLVAVVIRLFWKVDRTAAWLLVPYIVWLTFAVGLNVAIIIMI